MKIIMLTDHSSHTVYDSVYALPKAISNHSVEVEVYAASRAISGDHFSCQSEKLDCCVVDSGFDFSARNQYFCKSNMTKMKLSDFNIVFFRIDRPVPDEYLNFTKKIAPDAKFVNSPKGLIKTSSKEFLANFEDICPPFIIAKSLDEIENFNKKFPIVLKPLGGYGGAGLVKIVDFDNIFIEDVNKTGTDARKFLDEMKADSYPIMAMKYLKNVHKGDKRILVVAGECLGAVLRVPKKGSWLCNLAQGASSEPAQLTKDEVSIIEKVDKVLLNEGITVYGIDTLVNDDGKRIMSEINTTNVGGFVQLENTSGKNILAKTAGLILNRLQGNDYEFKA